MGWKIMKQNENPNMQIWEIKEGNITAIKFFGRIFAVKEGIENKEIVEMVDGFNEIIEIPEPEMEEFKPEIEEIEPEMEEFEPEMETKTKPESERVVKRKYAKRVAQSRIKQFTPILNDKGIQEKESGIPLFEEFRTVIFENFTADEEFSNQDVAKLFVERFPDYSAMTLKNRASAYTTYLMRKDKVVLDRVEGNKRIMKLKKVSMSDDEVKHLNQIYHDNRKVMQGIL